MPLPVEAWKPVPSVGFITQRPGCGGEAYARVMDQLNVEKEPRYLPRDGMTFCNIFVWDVTRLMSCEVPHWVDEYWRPTRVGGGRETDANAIVESLHRGRWGWKPCSRPRDCANEGWPVIAGWANARGPGHVAMVRPGAGETLMVSQAGATNGREMPLAQAFGRKPVLYWFHDGKGL